MSSARVVLTLRNDLSELTRLDAELDAFCDAHDVSTVTRTALNLVLEELLTNTISYGYTDDAEHRIEVELRLRDGHVEGCVKDDALPFNPLNRASPDVSADLEEQEIIGLGVMLVRQLMDHAVYDRANGQNIVTFRKRADASP